MSPFDPRVSDPAHDHQAGSRGEQFIWPPRQAHSDTSATPPQARGDATPSSVRTNRSPPAPQTGSSPIPAAPPPSSAATPSGVRRFLVALRQILHDTERTWFDVQCPVLAERLHALGWRPDPPEVYCHRCGWTVGPHDATSRACSRCEHRRPAWKRLVRLGVYRPPLKRLVQEVKFTRWRRLGADLGDLLAESVAGAIAAERRRRPDLPSRVVVIPVPTTFRRRMGRGIDHTTILAAQVARRLNAPLLLRVLKRDHRPSQVSVQSSDRARNVANTIHPRRRRGTDLRNTLVIVVDDVTTTGATLRAACRGVIASHRAAAGREAPFELWTAVVAVTEPDERPKQGNNTVGCGEGESGK